MFINNVQIIFFKRENKTYLSTYNGSLYKCTYYKVLCCPIGRADNH